MGDKSPLLAAPVGPLLTWIFAVLVEGRSTKDGDVGRVGLREAGTRSLGADILFQ